MSEQKKLLRQSFSILHSCLSVVLISYIFDVLYARIVHLGWGPAAVAVIIPIKIYIFSGLYGALSEIVSGEEIVLKFRNVEKNAKEFWKIYLLLCALPFVFHFAISLAGLNSFNIPIYVIYAHLNIFILYGMAYYIFRKKYLPSAEKVKKIPPSSLRMVISLFGLYILNVMIFDLPYFYDPGSFDLTRFTLLGYYYLHFAVFLYIAVSLQSVYPEVEKQFNHDHEIYLINPAGGGLVFHLSSMFFTRYPPVFVVIKALTPKRYHFREFNQLPWQERYYAGQKLVALTCYTSNSSDCYRLAMEFRKRGSKVIIGGPHVTFLPDEALEYCDSVVVGELENVWDEVIADYENNSLKKKYAGTAVKECHDLIHQELLNSPPEVIKDFLETSRGCKFKCHFCSVPSISGGTVRTKRTFDVVELIAKIRPKYKSILFIDNNIYSDPAYAKELFMALKPLNIRWATQCTLDIAKNDEVLRLAKESGCVGLLIGFEISESSLEKQEGGKLGMAQKYKEYAKKIHDMGIRIKAHFIFGFEQDSLVELWNFWKFCFSLQPFISIMSILTPFPGTKVYSDMLKEDCISNLNWRYYGCHSMVFDHKNIHSDILRRVWPLVFAFFLFTTSKIGYFLFFVIVCLCIFKIIL